MASTTLHCTPLLVGRGWEGSSTGGTAVTPKCNSSAMSAIAINFHPTGGFEKTILSGGGKREAGGKFRSLTKSSSFNGPVDSSRHRGSDNLRCSTVECHNFSRAPQAQAVQAIPGNVEMLETFEIEEKVRDYELDHYGVVNNAVYAQFCQQARTELLEHVGFSPDGVTESGKSMAISDMSLKYISPLRSGDRYIVSSRVAGTTAVRLLFEDHIYRLPERELVMMAKSTVVVLDRNAKPGRLPNEIKVKLVNGYLTNYHVNGNATNGNVNGNSTNGHVNGNSTRDDVNSNSTRDDVNGNLTRDDVNGNSMTDYVNGNSMTDYVNGNSMTDYVNGNSLIVHLNGNSMTEYVNGNSMTEYVNGNSRTREVALVA